MGCLLYFVYRNSELDARKAVTNKANTSNASRHDIAAVRMRVQMSYMMQRQEASAILVIRRSSAIPKRTVHKNIWFVNIGTHRYGLFALFRVPK